MAETEGATSPFWSPDGQNIGFFATDGKLRKIRSEGEATQKRLAGVPWVVYGGTWYREGVIVFLLAASGFFRFPPRAELR